MINNNGPRLSPELNSEGEAGPHIGPQTSNGGHPATPAREQADLLNLTHDSIYVRDLRGTIRYWNRAAEELYGWHAEQAVGKVVHELLKTVLPAPIEQIEAELLRTGRWEGELVHTKKDGGDVIVACRWSLQRDENGAPLAILSTNNDITERKRAEQARAELEEQWRATFESNPTMYFILDAVGEIVSVNTAGAQQLGYGVSELIGQPVLNVFYEPDRSFVRSHATACFEQPGRMVRWEARKIRKDGTMLWVRETANAVLLRKRPVLLVVCEDITEQKLAEALLSGEKRILEMVARGNSLVQILESLCLLAEEQAQGVLASVLLVDDGRLQHGVGPSLPRAYIEDIDGVAIGPAAGSCGTAAYLARQVIVCDIASDPLWVDYRHLALRHSLRACWSTPIMSPGSTVIGTFALYYCEPRNPTSREQDIIEQITHLAGIAIQRKLTEQRLQRSEAYLAEAQSLSHTGSWATDALMRNIVYSSEELMRMYGFDPQEGMPTTEAFRARIHPEDLRKLDESMPKAARQKADFNDDYRILLPDGTVRHIKAISHPFLDANGEIVEYVGTAVDVTERKRAEQERERVRQLEADLAHINRITVMGELAATLAHEINQPIAAAITDANACLRWLNRDPPELTEAREAAMSIVGDGTRAAEIITRVRSFYRKGSPVARVPVDVNEVAREMLGLLHNEADRRSIALHTELTDLPAVVADRVQLQQVFMNLMLNGIEAMKESTGELTVRSQWADDGGILISVS
jgi:PAS domain S-box-containing protein